MVVSVIVTVIMTVIMTVIVIVSVIVTVLSSLDVLKKNWLLTWSKSTMHWVTKLLDCCLELVL